MTDHPIIPPSEMVNEWVRMLEFLPDKQVFSEVAQWGADQELEACIAFVRRGPWCSEKLRAARRPKPPSLKEQAIAVLKNAGVSAAHYNILLRGLEQLND